MFHVKHLPPAAADRPVVRVILPSGAIRPCDAAAFDTGLSTLEQTGFEMRFDPVRRAAIWRDYYAGSDAERAAEFVAALDEPGVDIVWWGRGGSGSGRLVSQVVDAARHRAPRIIIGFSDATALLNALASQLGWVTFHGPAITSTPRADLDHLRRVVHGATTETPFTGEGPPLRGRIFGGNLMVLGSLVGTPAMPPAAGTIWLLEEVNEAAYRVDRSVAHLRAAGCTAGAAGVWLGPLYPDLADADARNRVQEDLALPGVTGAPAGHSGPMRLIPLGAPVEIDPSAGCLRGLSSWVHRG